MAEAMEKIGKPAVATAPAPTEVIDKAVERPMDLNRDGGPVKFRPNSSFSCKRIVAVNRVKAPDLAEKPYVKWTDADKSRRDCYRKISVPLFTNFASYPVNHDFESIVYEAEAVFDSPVDRDNELKAHGTYRSAYAMNRDPNAGKAAKDW